jgi:predicted GIY-YIG superfamily endonuclease
MTGIAYGVLIFLFPILIIALLFKRREMKRQGRKRYGKWYIYGLSDPREDRIRYIGATTNPQRRLAEHRRGFRQGSYLKKWVKRIQSEGVEPEMTILEETDWNHWEEREKARISWARQVYGTMLNRQDGGVQPYVRNPKRRVRRKI